MAEQKVLDVVGFSKQRAQVTYPYFKILDVNGVTPSVVGMLEEGDIPLAGVYQGKTALLKKVSMSAYNVDKILRTHEGVLYVINEGEEHYIKKIEEYLELL